MIGIKKTVLAESVVDDVIKKHPRRTGDVLGILEDLQRQHPQRYLPEETLGQVARKLGLSPSRIFSVATFYSFFNLQPQGEHTVIVCRGTACHTRGSKTLLDRVKRSRNVVASEDGETYSTPDGSLTIRTVACFGQCALAPVVGMDETIHSYVTELGLDELMKTIEK